MPIVYLGGHFMENKNEQSIVEVHNDELMAEEIKSQMETMDAAQAMSFVTSALIDMSRQVAMNNAEKYKAQASVMIAELQANMEIELKDIEGHYDVRIEQEKTFAKIIQDYQDAEMHLIEAGCNAKDEMAREFIKEQLEDVRKGFGKKLDSLATNIQSEQNKRIEISKPRNKGIFGLLGRK